MLGVAWQAMYRHRVMHVACCSWRNISGSNGVQARLARQLKEAMAERQMAKTESKALHTQLDKVQKQVSHIRIHVFVWYAHSWSS